MAINPEELGRLVDVLAVYKNEKGSKPDYVPWLDVLTRLLQDENPIQNFLFYDGAGSDGVRLRARLFFAMRGESIWWTQPKNVEQILSFLTERFNNNACVDPLFLVGVFEGTAFYLQNLLPSNESFGALGKFIYSTACVVRFHPQAEESSLKQFRGALSNAVVLLDQGCARVQREALAKGFFQGACTASSSRWWYRTEDPVSMLARALLHRTVEHGDLGEIAHSLGLVVNQPCEPV